MECKQSYFEHMLHSCAPEPAVTLAEYKTVHLDQESPMVACELNEWVTEQ